MQTHKSKTLVEFNATVGSAIIAVDLHFFKLIKKRNWNCIGNGNCISFSNIESWVISNQPF